MPTSPTPPARRSCAWLACIIGNLLLVGDHYDIALRDVGLLLGALALARLANATSPRGAGASRSSAG